MWRNNKVLVIDDSESRRHDLKVLLEFLSETTLTAGSKTWQQLVQSDNKSEEYTAVFIGDFLTKLNRKKAKYPQLQVMGVGSKTPTMLAVLYHPNQTLWFGEDQ